MIADLLWAVLVVAAVGVLVVGADYVKHWPYIKCFRRVRDKIDSSNTLSLTAFEFECNQRPFTCTLLFATGMGERRPVTILIRLNTKLAQDTGMPHELSRHGHHIEWRRHYLTSRINFENNRGTDEMVDLIGSRARLLIKIVAEVESNQQRC